MWTDILHVIRWPHAPAAARRAPLSLARGLRGDDRRPWPLRARLRHAPGPQPWRRAVDIPGGALRGAAPVARVVPGAYRRGGFLRGASAPRRRFSFWN